MLSVGRHLARAQVRRCWRALSTNIQECEPKKGDKVVVGMSGGVDSSVTARLLADQDFDLSAVFMRNWDTRDETGTDRGCEWEKDWEDVQLVCKALGIRCRMVDLSKEYWNRVFEPSLKQWETGVTPNPDVWCNKEIKFGALLDRMNKSTSYSNAWFATGHYAQKRWHTPSSGLNASPRPQLIRALDPTKDQSFYLSSISEVGLSRALFPIGHLQKSEVRDLARQFKLPTAERQESMGLCFVGERGRFSRFLSSYIKPNPGPIISLQTDHIIGVHQGLWEYTIGEKTRISGLRNKMYVVRKDIPSNTIWVTSGSNNPSLYCSKLHVIDFAWIWADLPPTGLDHSEGFHAGVKFRHRMSDVGCTVRRSSSSTSEQDPNDANKSITVVFDEPQKAAAPGQVAALYDGDWCLGCGVIAETS